MILVEHWGTCRWGGGAVRDDTGAHNHSFRHQQPAHRGKGLRRPREFYEFCRFIPEKVGGCRAQNIVDSEVVDGGGRACPVDACRRGEDATLQRCYKLKVGEVEKVERRRCSVGRRTGGTGGGAPRRKVS